MRGLIAREAYETSSMGRADGCRPFTRDQTNAKLIQLVKNAPDNKSAHQPAFPDFAPPCTNATFYGFDL